MVVDVAAAQMDGQPVELRLPKLHTRVGWS